MDTTTTAPEAGLAEGGLETFSTHIPTRLQVRFAVAMALLRGRTTKREEVAKALERHLTEDLEPRANEIRKTLNQQG